MIPTRNITMGFLAQQAATSSTDAAREINFSTHLAVVGATGLGKTRKILDIHDSRFAQGHGMLWFDPKNVVYREIIHRAKDKKKIYRLGIPGGGKNDIRINILSLLTESEEKMDQFCLSFFSKRGKMHSDFWTTAAAKMFFTSAMLYMTLSRILCYVNTLTGEEKSFSSLITYDGKNNEEEKRISFLITSSPITMEYLYEQISNRENFRQTAGNIHLIVEAFFSEMQTRLASCNLTVENLLQIGIWADDIKRFAKEFNTYILPAGDDSSSGRSGVWFTMCSSIPRSFYSDPSLNAAHHSHDTKALLESGQCIVVSLGNEQLMSTLFNYYAEYFSLRASMHDVRSITIILEEANRLLNTGIEIDIERIITFSRQAKLSVVTVFQSWGQAKKAFGEVA